MNPEQSNPDEGFLPPYTYGFPMYFLAVFTIPLLFDEELVYDRFEVDLELDRDDLSVLVFFLYVFAYLLLLLQEEKMNNIINASSVMGLKTFLCITDKIRLSSMTHVC
ncbi:MAG: hypothetical protein ACJATI_001891 [Halioglobus sp.]